MALLLAQSSGFLPTRGSVMLDFVFVAMIGVIPILGVSVYLVKFRRKFNLHKKIQITLGLVLLVTVAAFEIDMQFVTDWEALAKPSPYFSTWVKPSLYIHLCFAVPTPILWTIVIVRAIRQYPCPPSPNEHSPSHIFWARLASATMFMTAVTGWIFYYLAFIASS